MNRSISDLAARQYSNFTARQAAACGYHPSTLHDHVKQGLIMVMHPGVYSWAGSPQSWERSLMAALLAAGPGAAASHRSGGRVWEITDGRDDTVEITVPRSRSPRLHGVVVHRSRDLVPDHSILHHRIPVTKPARTIVDLGAVLAPDRVEDALDRALTRQLISIAGVEWMLNEVSRQGRRGAGVAAGILDERALGRAPADGQLEPRMARLLRNAKLPPAVYHHVIRDGNGCFLAEVDFAYPALKLAIEVDGFEVHGTPRAMGRDFIRQNGLVPHRWLVLRFTWRQVVRQPEYVAASIGASLSGLAAAAQPQLTQRLAGGGVEQ
ncbi:MAG: type IV toxin-antitoxin system AbiEi family antitoxin domain-containing protein, partial [Acidimicrobiia bacterium]